LPDLDPAEIEPLAGDIYIHGPLRKSNQPSETSPIV
jgi:hypothetical protein